MGSFTPPTTDFLTEDEKADWVAKKVQFMILDVKEGDGKFGHGYTYKLGMMDPKTGEIVSTHAITLSDNYRRAEEAEYIRASLLEDKSGLGPCLLAQRPTDKGNPAWVFEAVES